jgi:ribosomal protein S18 acetylase RimI-like enzyme
MPLQQALASCRAVQARRIDETDAGFLKSLFASTRRQELAAIGWPAARQQAFLDQQFEFQHRYYREHFADADFLLLQQDGRAIGRLLWHEGPSPAAQATLIDISLVPGSRGQGLGSSLLDVLVRHADDSGRTIGLHVEPDNPAQRLYRRFGFEVTGDGGVYLKMRRLARVAAAG